MGEKIFLVVDTRVGVGCRFCGGGVVLTLVGCRLGTSFDAFFVGASCVCDRLFSWLTFALLDVPYLSLLLCLNALCSSALILGASSMTPKGMVRRTAVGV